MDDLIAYIIALLRNDAKMLALFTGAGAKQVLAYSPNLRAEASYPRILIWGDEGSQEESGDLSPILFDGCVKIDIYTRQSDANPDALTTLVNIKNRLEILLLGNPTPGSGVMEIRGTAVGDYFVSRFYRSKPTGRVPVMGDPTIRRWTSTYNVLLNRHLFTEGV